jgi:PAS domain S-box-containing protein
MTGPAAWVGGDGSSDMDVLPDAVVRIDGARRVVRANATAAKLTGYDAAQLVGRDLAEVLELRGRDGKRLCVDGWHPSASLRSVRALPEQDILFRRSDGQEARAHVTAAYERDPDGRITGAILVLREAGRRAHQAATGIEIVSTVSHELRAPLTSVKGYTSLLLNRWDRLKDDQKQMMLEQVNHDADRVTRLITELLDISRLETGRLVLRRQLVDLPVLAATVLEKVRLEYHELEAEVSFSEDFPKVYADPDKVEQVLTNLLENACKYAAPTGMQVTGEIGQGEVAVTVTDQGEGIPEMDLPKVFTKFFRRSEGRPTGSGLGLWISRGLVEAHGGRLIASSIPGQGTAFRFTLPLIDLDKLHSP